MRKSSRFRPRKDALKRPGFMRSLEEGVEILTASENRFALIGGIAVSLRANPPATVDIDFLVDANSRKAIDRLVDLFEEEGWRVDLLFLPLGGLGLVGTKYKVRVDFLTTAGNSFLKRVIAHSEGLEVGKVTVPTATPEDLYLMKMLAGRDKDIADMYVLSKLKGFDMTYVRKQRVGLLGL